MTLSGLTVNIFFYNNDPSPVRIAFRWRNQTPVACKGEQILWYICALLEADIAGHITHRPAMKVTRFLYSSAYHLYNAEHLPHLPLQFTPARS
ncbi:hypothetical protein [Xenorhabdus sp. Sc-CR9]|uniref:hypothetical protein n=1 Tax=Xenorhabdus sp. Sc-CR9 TaxID=2584468 RepID=UPI001F180561|nr:hypothetical protein [Xenorhabdus sp. Sc-CR9]